MKTKIKPDERVEHLVVHENLLHLLLKDGRHLMVPLDWFPRLQSATKEQLSNWTITAGGFVVRWPEIDEDLEIAGLLAGNAAPERRASDAINASQIREYRQRAKLSQAALAQDLGVRQATISDWEKGKSAPSPLASNRLAEAIRLWGVRAPATGEDPTYRTNDYDLSIVGSSVMSTCESKASLRVMEMCQGAWMPWGTTILLAECKFTDLLNEDSAEVCGPRRPTRFNPTTLFTQGWALAKRA